jgi:hypothetical protein
VHLQELCGLTRVGVERQARLSSNDSYMATMCRGISLIGKRTLPRDYRGATAGHRPNVGTSGKAFSHQRGTPVQQGRRVCCFLVIEMPLFSLPSRPCKTTGVPRSQKTPTPNQKKQEWAHHKGLSCGRRVRVMDPLLDVNVCTCACEYCTR